MPAPNVTQGQCVPDGLPSGQRRALRYPAAAARDRRAAASNEAMTMYRAGIVGLGVGIRHARAYTGSDATDLVAIADLDAALLDEVGRTFDVPHRFTSLEAMLEHETLDIVSVATPCQLHAPMVIAAAEARPKAIICEKPMAPDMGSVEAMTAACDEHGVKLVIGHMRRQLPQFAHARRLIADGAIGRPLAGTVSVQEGGLLNQASHVVDLIRFMLGDPAVAWAVGQVQRETDRYERGLPAEDLCGGVIAFEDGARLVLDVDIGANPTVGNWGFVLAGDEGVLRVTSHQAQGREAFDLHLVSRTHGDVDLASTEFPEVDPWIAQFDRLAEWIDGGPEHEQSIARTQPSHEALMAIYESARTRSRVTLPLNTRRSPLEAMIQDGQLTVRYPGAYDIRRPEVYPPVEA